jgi:hypothetical protein
VRVDPFVGFVSRDCTATGVAVAVEVRMRRDRLLIAVLALLLSADDGKSINA